VRAFDADRQTLYRNLWYQQCPGAIRGSDAPGIWPVILAPSTG
jgi:hypothetical protein